MLVGEFYMLSADTFLLINNLTINPMTSGACFSNNKGPGRTFSINKAPNIIAVVPLPGNT
jgi:hypothetical protein